MALPVGTALASLAWSMLSMLYVQYLLPVRSIPPVRSMLYFQSMLCMLPMLSMLSRLLTVSVSYRLVVVLTQTLGAQRVSHPSCQNLSQVPSTPRCPGKILGHVIETPQRAICF